MPQSNSDMHSIRRQNLHALIREFAQARLAAGEATSGTERAFAELVQMSKSLLSHLKSSRPISDANARQIEACCKKTDGWLSAEHNPTQSMPAPGEEALVARLRERYRGLSRTQRARLRQLVDKFQ